MSSSGSIDGRPPRAWRGAIASRDKAQVQDLVDPAEHAPNRHPLLQPDLARHSAPLLDLPSHHRLIPRAAQAK